MNALFRGILTGLLIWPWLVLAEPESTIETGVNEDVQTL